MANEDNFLTQLMEQDDITWQSMIFELVKSQEMDPWDIDISQLAQRFIAMLSEMKDMNMKIGGKVVLASTILLRLKSGRFIDSDLAQLEALISGMNSDYEDDFEEWNDFQDGLAAGAKKDRKNYKIYPRTPQPRSRKVSVYDLVTALEGVIEKQKIKVNYRKPSKDPVEVKISSMDINLVIRDVFETLNQKTRARNTNKLKFSDITPSQRKEDLVATFVPLLHLTNQRVTDLYQDEAFSDFDVHLIKEGMTFEDLEKVVDEVQE